MTVFVDSTTLLYTLDRANPTKQARCARLLRDLRNSGRLRLNIQVLNECYAVVRRKPAFAAARPGVRAYLLDHWPWVRASLNTDTISRAWRLEDTYGASWWDALLLASASQAGCRVFLSEDLNDGQVYEGVQVISPFGPSSETVLAALG